MCIRFILCGSLRGCCPNQEPVQITGFPPVRHAVFKITTHSSLIKVFSSEAESQLQAQCMLFHSGVSENDSECVRLLDPTGWSATLSCGWEAEIRMRHWSSRFRVLLLFHSALQLTSRGKAVRLQLVPWCPDADTSLHTVQLSDIQ